MSYASKSLGLTPSWPDFSKGDASHDSPIDRAIIIEDRDLEQGPVARPISGSGEEYVRRFIQVRGYHPFQGPNCPNCDFPNEMMSGDACPHCGYPRSMME